MDDNKTWESHHWTSENKPNGGTSYGIGFIIAWQRGSLIEEGRNGAYLIEVLEACEDELRHKNTYFPCQENEDALPHLQKCLEYLRSRIERRKTDGIYGTHHPDQ